MPDINRRRFLQLAGATAAFSAMANSIEQAAAIPAHRRYGSIQDVEHIVVLMQENRSFDHYFGTLKGVRGFGDPRPVTLPSGKPIWHQASGTGQETLPFHPEADDLGLQFLQGLPHSWPDGHQAINDGKYDQWIPAKSAVTMAYLTREDIPFHFALADKFTDLRRVPLLVHRRDRPEPLLPVDRLHRQRRHRRRPGPRQRRARLRLDDVPGAARAGRCLVEDLPGHRRRPGRGRPLGLDRRRVPRQLRRQLAAVLQQLPQRRARESACTTRPARARTPRPATACSTNSPPM